jgi:hypothetical protein
MTKNKDYRKQLEGQYRALAEHLDKIAIEQQKPQDEQDPGLILHWKKPSPIAVSKLSNSKRGSTDDNQA